MFIFGQIFLFLTKMSIILESIIMFLELCFYNRILDELIKTVQPLNRRQAKTLVSAAKNLLKDI